MIDHVSLRVSDLSRATPLYRAALAPLGYQLVAEFPGAVGLGVRGKPDFWITQAEGMVSPTHLAFVADRAGVHAFHEAALRAGASDNGAPGPRPDYHPHYYAAFVLDFDGNNIEAVSHVPEGAASARSAKAGGGARAKRPSKARPRAKSPARGRAGRPKAAKPRATVKAKAKAKPAGRPRPRPTGRRRARRGG